MNAWICAPRTTDHDLESVSAMKTKVNAWICAPQATDHDPAHVILNKICNICNVCNFMRILMFLELIIPVTFVTVCFFLQILLVFELINDLQLKSFSDRWCSPRCLAPLAQLTSLTTAVGVPVHLHWEAVPVTCFAVCCRIFGGTCWVFV